MPANSDGLLILVLTKENPAQKLPCDSLWLIVNKPARHQEQSNSVVTIITFPHPYHRPADFNLGLGQEQITRRFYQVW